MAQDDLLNREQYGSRPLEPQQLRFVEEYVLDSSSLYKAAIRAGYSIETARQQASRLYKDPRVQKMISEAQDNAVERLGLTLGRVLQEIWKVAGANPGDVVTTGDDGEAQIDPSKASEVFVSTSTDGNKKIRQITAKTVKPADKIAALALIAKVMDMMPKERVEVSGVSWVDVLETSYKVVSDNDTALPAPKEVPSTSVTPELEDKV